MRLIQTIKCKRKQKRQKEDGEVDFDDGFISSSLKQALDCACAFHRINPCKLDIGVVCDLALLENTPADDELWNKIEKRVIEAFRKAN